MAETTDYALVATVKGSPYLNISGSTDDTALGVILTAVSRWIDTVTGTRFYANTETRYYTPEWGDYLVVDDLLSVTTLKTDEDGDRTYEVTWQTTDYDLEPYNATLMQPPQPYWTLRVTPKGNYSFPIIRKSVEIAGSWGYCTSANRPATVQQACLMGTMRLWERHKAILGVAGSADLGQLQAFVPTLRRDPDIMHLLSTIPRRGQVWAA